MVAYTDPSLFLESKPPASMEELGECMGFLDLPCLAAEVIYDQLHSEQLLEPGEELGSEYYKTTSIRTFHSAVATYYTPSDLSGVGRMHCECIHVTPSWRSGSTWYDCIFANGNASKSGVEDLLIAHIQKFVSFKHEGVLYSCAIVEWFSIIGSEPDALTGMWIVKPNLSENGEPLYGMLHLESIMRGAHLIGVYGEDPLPSKFHFSDSLDAFCAYYVNKYADHHAHEIAF